MIRGQAKRAGSAQPAEGEAQEQLIHVCKYLMEFECKEEGARLFSVVPSERTRSNVHKLKEIPFQSKNKAFYCTGDQTLDQIERGCSLHPWRYSNQLNRALSSLL